MARPNKVGIPYFGMDTDFFEDTRIKILLSKYGSDGVAAYLKIVSTAYKEHGYYFPADEDSLLIMSGELSLKHQYLEEIITFMCTKNLFDPGLMQSSSILTCERMQKQYLAGTERRSEVHLNSQYLLIDPLKIIGKSHKADIYIDGKCITEEKLLHNNNEDKQNTNPVSESKVKADSKVKNFKTKEVDPALFNAHFEEIKNLYISRTRIQDPNITTHIKPVIQLYAGNPFPEYLNEGDITTCIAKAFSRLDKTKGVRVDWLCKNIQSEISKMWEDCLYKQKESVLKEAEQARRREREAEKKEKNIYWTNKKEEYLNYFEKNLNNFSPKEIAQINKYLQEGNLIGAGSILEPKIEAEKTKV